jgi:hypothetical protein
MPSLEGDPPHTPPRDVRLWCKAAKKTYRHLFLLAMFDQLGFDKGQLRLRISDRSCDTWETGPGQESMACRASDAPRSANRALSDQRLCGLSGQSHFDSLPACEVVAQSPSENLPGLMSAVSSPMGIPQATGRSLVRHCPRPSILAG